MTLKRYAFPAVIVLAIALLAFSYFNQPAFGNVTTDVPAVTPNTFREYTFFATTTNQTIFATSTTATSTNIATWTDDNGNIDRGMFVITGAKRVVVTFKRGDTLGTGNTGSNTFRLQVTQKASPAEADWYFFDRFNSATTTGSISTIALTSTSTSMVAMDLLTAQFYAIRVISNETTDGDVKVSAAAIY